MNFTLSSNTNDKQLKHSFYLLFSLIVASLYIKLGDQPLYLEEPRRALIALEMLFRNNLIVPTEFGELYYNKPPLWNWVIIFSYKIFGVNEFAVRFFSVLSFILTGSLIYFMGKKYVNLRFGILSSLFFLISADIYFYFSATGEIDLFYTLITFGSFISIFHFYHQKKFFALFITTYFLGALGALTKGVPSLAFLGISLLVFFIYNKDFKKLFSLAHFAGIGVYISVIGLFAYAYSQYYNPIKFIDAIWTEASGRTAISKGFLDSIIHLFVFPLDFLKNIIPASLFILFAIKKDFFKKIRENKFIEFSFFIFAANILIYWLSPGTRPRYVYMLFPLAINILVYFYISYSQHQQKLNSILEVIWGIIIGLFALVFTSLFFLEVAENLTLRIFIASFFFIILCLLCYLYFKNRNQRIFIFIISIIVLRFGFNFTVLELRSTESDIQYEKEIALELAKYTKNEKLHFYRTTGFSRTMIFYLEKEKKMIIDKAKEKDKNEIDYFIVNNKYKDYYNHTLFYDYELDGKQYYLIKFTEP